MSRYDDLCNRYAKARGAAEARRDRCAAVVEKLRERVRVQLGAPEDAVGYRALDADTDEPTALPLTEALSVAEDGAWQVGIQIMLRDPAKPDAPFHIFFGVRMREDDGRLVVSLSDDDPGRAVSADDGAAIEAVAADAQRRLEDWLAANLDRALGAPGAPERYGVYL
ncbi:MAG: hypothetical protein DCC71_16475 [Proteobacteria bacterium]|nr:MAG: hypothetical protein DCC71_16475 [Pseudomonadota bacterium]